MDIAAAAAAGKEIIMSCFKFETCSQFWRHIVSLVLFRNNIYRFPGVILYFPGFFGLLMPLFRSAVAPPAVFIIVTRFQGDLFLLQPHLIL